MLDTNCFVILFQGRVGEFLLDFDTSLSSCACSVPFGEELVDHLRQEEGCKRVRAEILFERKLSSGKPEHVASKTKFPTFDDPIKFADVLSDHQRKINSSGPT